MTIAHLSPVNRWECPSCHNRHVTIESRPHTPMHSCPALGGLQAPYVYVPREAADGLGRHAARHVLVERGDYIGDEKVLLDAAGRPVMAVRTDHADGSNDVTVFAPTATVAT